MHVARGYLPIYTHVLGTSDAKFWMAKADWTDSEWDIISLYKVEKKNAPNEGQILLKDKPEIFPVKIEYIINCLSEHRK